MKAGDKDRKEKNYVQNLNFMHEKLETLKGETKRKLAAAEELYKEILGALVIAREKNDDLMRRLEEYEPPEQDDVPVREEAELPEQVGGEESSSEVLEEG